MSSFDVATMLGEVGEGSVADGTTQKIRLGKIAN